MVDRNKAARDQQQAQYAAAQQRKQFISQVAAGQTGAYDKDGKLVEAKHLVFWEPPPFLRWLVEDVGPALDQPGPAMRVTLTATVPLIVRPGQPVQNLVIWGSQGEPPADGEKTEEEGSTDGAAKEPADGASTIIKPGAGD